MVTKILFDKDRSIGVEYISYTKSQYPYKADTQYKPSKHTFKKVYAKKEIILTTGAIQTTQLLLLSGIIPKEELDKHKIPIIKDLPVGTNIQDHIDADLIHEIKKDSIIYNTSKKSNLLIYHDEYIKTGKCIASTNRFTYGYFWWVSDENKNPTKPDVHVYSWNGPLDVIDRNNKLILFDPNKSYHSTLIETMYPETFEYIKLKSIDPFDTPIIEENFGDNTRDNKILSGIIKQAVKYGKVKSYYTFAHLKR